MTRLRAPLVQLVAEWFRGSSNRLILGAAVTVGALSVAVKLVAMVKESAVAYWFGTADAVDAFVVAFLLPSMVINVVAGAFTSAFTPVYVGVRETQGPGAASRLLASATAASAVVVTVVTLALAVGFPLALDLLQKSFGPDKLILTRSLFLLLLPTIPLSMLVTIFSATLNAEQRFALAALAPVSVPLLSLVAVLLGAGAWGVYSLGVGMVCGYLLQCAWLGVALRRRGLGVLPRWHGLTPELRRLAAQYGPTAGGALLATGSSTIAQAMAALLPAGSVATLNYGSKIVAAITEIGSMAIATAVLPHFSLMVARREWPAIRRTLSVYTRLLAVVAFPATLVLIGLSSSIVQILFQRGAFTAGDTRAVATVQSLLLIQVPFVVVGMFFVRLASALERNDIQLWGALISVPLQVVLTLALMRWLGVAGIALATSLVFVVSCSYLVVSVRYALRSREARSSVDSSDLR